MKNKNLGFLDVWNEETEQKIDSRIAWLKEHPEEGRKIMEELEKNLREVTNEPIDLYLMMPSDEQIQRNISQNPNYKDVSVEEIKSEMRKIEIPSGQEGFEKVYVVTEKGIEDWTDKPAEEKKISSKTELTMKEWNLSTGISEKNIFGQKPFKHICEVCGKVEILTSKEAYETGWDYPGVDGIYKCENFKIMTPRTCGQCGITETAWWALSVEGKSLNELSEMQKLAVERITQEPENLMVEEER